MDLSLRLSDIHFENIYLIKTVSFDTYNYPWSWLFWSLLNPVQAASLFLYPLKTSENQRSLTFQRYRDQRHEMGYEICNTLQFTVTVACFKCIYETKIFPNEHLKRLVLNNQLCDNSLWTTQKVVIWAHVWWTELCLSNWTKFL